MGQVGEDAIGSVLAEDLRHRGVETFIRHAGGTGVIVTTVGGGVRSRLIDRGASRRLTQVAPTVLDDVDQLYLAASAFTEDPLASAVDRLLAEVRAARIPVVIGGPGTADLDLLGVEPFLELIAAVGPDAVVLNRSEHASLGIAPREGLPGATATVITAGPRPTLVIESDRQAESVAVPPVEHTRDRTGVGDGFLTGFMASRRTGADAVAASHAGHRIAAKVIANLGPTVGH